MKTAFLCSAVAALLMSVPAAAQDNDQTAASASETPAAAWSKLRFDLAHLDTSRAADHDRAVQARNGVDLAVSPRVVASVEADVNARGVPIGGVSVAPTFRQETSVTGRLGVLVGPRALLYGRFGYTELDTNERLTAVTGQPRSLVGVLVGAGSELRLSPAVSVRTEYQYVDYATSTTSTRVLTGVAFRF